MFRSHSSTSSQYHKIKRNLAIGNGNISSVQFSSVQFSSVQFSSVQFSSVQFSSVQFSSVERNVTQLEIAVEHVELSVLLCAAV